MVCEWYLVNGRMMGMPSRRPWLDWEIETRPIGYLGTIGSDSYEVVESTVLDGTIVRIHSSCSQHNQDICFQDSLALMYHIHTKNILLSLRYSLRLVLTTVIFPQIPRTTPQQVFVLKLLLVWLRLSPWLPSSQKVLPLRYYISRSPVFLPKYYHALLH